MLFLGPCLQLGLQNPEVPVFIIELLFVHYLDFRNVCLMYIRHLQNIVVLYRTGSGWLPDYEKTAPCRLGQGRCTCNGVYSIRKPLCDRRPDTYEATLLVLPNLPDQSVDILCFQWLERGITHLTHNIPIICNSIAACIVQFRNLCHGKP